MLIEVTDAITRFGGNHQRTATLASVLGFQPYHTSTDLLGGRMTPLNPFLLKTAILNEGLDRSVNRPENTQPSVRYLQLFFLGTGSRP